MQEFLMIKASKDQQILNEGMRYAGNGQIVNNGTCSVG